MKNQIRNPMIHNQRGQSLVEYLILVALMAVATMGAIRIVGQNISGQFANISNVLRGETTREQLHKVRSSDTQKKDFSDFMNGATSK